MNGTLTIEGDLTLLGKLAVKIDEWFPGAFAAEVGTPAWGEWDVETMAVLLRRLGRKQLELIQFVSSGGGYQSDEAVRSRLSNDDGGMKGLTGPISKHINAMIAAGDLAEKASPVVKTESNPDNRNLPGGFRMPADLLPVVRAALASL